MFRLPAVWRNGFIAVAAAVGGCAVPRSEQQNIEPPLNTSADAKEPANPQVSNATIAADANAGVIKASAIDSTSSKPFKENASPPVRASQLAARSIAFYEANPNYTCRVTRQERINGKLIPPETMHMNFRLRPRSIHYIWLDEANEGRECVYVDGQHGNKIITRGGKSDFMFVGKVMRVDPNGFLVKGRGRYSITESGIDNMVRRLEKSALEIEAGASHLGNIEVRGIVRREELDTPSIEVLQILAPGADPVFPDGARRIWHFDPETAHMQLLIGQDLASNLLEYYRFDRFIPNPSLSDEDFDPDRLWPSGRTAQTSATMRR